VGLDASETYIDGARRLRPHPGIEYELGDARHLPYALASFDACVSTLVIDVIAQVELVAAEMRRVTRPRGVVACATFDFWGGNSALDLVLDTGAALDASIRTLRSQIKARPIVWAHGQANLWRQVGLGDVVELPIVLSLDYTSFQDYWSSWSTGPTMVAQRLMAMQSDQRHEIEQAVRAGYLADLPDGPRSFAAIVRAVRGTSGWRPTRGTWIRRLPGPALTRTARCTTITADWSDTHAPPAASFRYRSVVNGWS
jgi:hypothetical protein